MAVIDRTLPPARGPQRETWWRRVRPTNPWAQIAVRFGGLGVLAVVLAFVHVPYRPSTFCILRGTTGIPCPFCGGTTAAASIGHGHPIEGLLANPMVVIVAVLLVTAPVTGFMRWWEGLTGRQRTWLALAALLVSEIWQLHRYGKLPWS